MQVVNRFDANKNYVGMGFHPRVLQDSELNEMLSIIQHQQAMINQLLYPNETLIKGSLVKSEEGFKGSEATVLIDGYYLHVPEKTVYADENDYLGIKYRARTVTAKEDESLRDDNKDSINYGMPGADRLVYDVDWAHSEEEPGTDWQFMATHRVKDGRPMPRKPVHDLSFLSSMSYDAIVGPGGFASIGEALENSPAKAKILVTVDSSHSEPIQIEKNHVEIHFAKGVHCGFADGFEGDALFLVGENTHASIKGGIFPFPDASKKLCIAASPTVFISEVFLAGNSPNVPDAVQNCKIFGLRG